MAKLCSVVCVMLDLIHESYTRKGEVFYNLHIYSKALKPGSCKGVPSERPWEDSVRCTEVKPGMQPKILKMTDTGQTSKK